MTCQSFPFLDLEIINEAMVYAVVISMNYQLISVSKYINVFVVHGVILEIYLLLQVNVYTSPRSMTCQSFPSL